jgi:hypothetical protein
LLAALDRHRGATSDGTTSVARRARAAAQVQAILADRLADRLDDPTLAGERDAVVDAVAAHALDPYAAADRLLTRVLGGD